jgi:hypothetical protein
VGARRLRLWGLAATYDRGDRALQPGEEEGVRPATEAATMAACSAEEGAAGLCLRPEAAEEEAVGRSTPRSCDREGGGGDAGEKTPRTSSLKVGEGERRPAGEADDEAEAVEPDISHNSLEEGMRGPAWWNPAWGSRDGRPRRRRAGRSAWRSCAGRT